MRTFYIFKINNDYYKITKDIPYNLYSAYLNIKLSTKNNISLLYNEFFNITDTINKNALNNIIYSRLKNLDGYSVYQNIHQYHNYYTDEESKLIVLNSYMIIKTNINNSSFFKEIMNIPNLFVIDFEKEDYFFLKNIKSFNNI